ncbi:hypothetical protein K8I61_06845 [bacterium]|nr:hypothetical protein [bacterium]
MMRGFGLTARLRAGRVLLACAILVLSFAAPRAAQAQADVPRTVFAIASINSGPLRYPIHVFAINGNQLEFSDEFRPDVRDGGPVGLAVDPYYEHLFVTYEFSNKVDAYDARDATPLGQITLSGTSDLSGIDVLESRNQLFVVDRTEKDIFVFDTQTFAPVTTWVLPTGQGAYDIEVFDDYQGADVIFVTDGTNTVRWYDVDTHQQIGSATQSRIAKSLGVNVESDAVIFSASIGVHTGDTPPQAGGHDYLVKYNTANSQQNEVDLGDSGRGIAVNAHDNVVYVSIGRYSTGIFQWVPASVRTFNMTTLAEVDRDDLTSQSCPGNVECSPTDVVVTRVAYGSELTKEVLSHPSGEFNIGANVTFRVTIRNAGARAIDIMPLTDTYDTTQLRYVSSSPASNDNIDDGRINWSDLTASFGNNLAPGASFQVDVTFVADPDACNDFVDGTNLSSMTNAKDDLGGAVADAAGTVGYRILCDCTTDNDCTDGVFCNGAEKCILNECQPGTPPCTDDGLYCNGAENCNEATDSCTNSGNPCSNDGVFCNGTESCVESTDSCASSGNPCGDDLFCNGNETCNENSDQCVSGTPPCADDGLFCNGVESCNEASDACASSGPPCSDDGQFCNGTESCNEDADSCPSSGDPCSDDGQFCNGAEFCDELANECRSNGNPCPEGQACLEDANTCEPPDFGDDDIDDDVTPDDDVDDDPPASDDDDEQDADPNIPTGDEEEGPGWPEGDVTGGNCCGC